VKENVPSPNSLALTEATYFILLSLTPGPSHGYAIMKDVQQLSRERVTLSTGTLYGALKRLLEVGWIERVEEPGVENGRERKAYRLTEIGEGVLQNEVDRLSLLVSAAQKNSSLARDSKSAHEPN
jgi:DNA-binding PadR family transcriptional regulator